MKDLQSSPGDSHGPARSHRPPAQLQLPTRHPKCGHIPKDSLFWGLELGHGSWLEGGHGALFSEQTGILSPMPENIWAED